MTDWEARAAEKLAEMATLRWGSWVCLWDNHERAWSLWSGNDTHHGLFDRVEDAKAHALARGARL